MMARIRRQLVVFVPAAAFSVQVSCVEAQPIESAAKASFESGRLYGAVVLSDGSDVIHRKGYGNADRGQGIPNEPGLQFPIHSITKSFTSILILQLVDAGRISLDDTLAERLPSFKCAAAPTITIHHLLCHQSGLPDYFMSIPGYLEREPPSLTREQAMAQVADMDLQFEPGSAFNYSNTNYILLGMILERETKLSFPELVEERLFERLGMDSTRVVTRSDPMEPLRFYTDAGKSEAVPDAFFVGESGVIATLDDLIAFGQALGSPTLLDPGSWSLAFTMHSSPANAHEPERGANAAPYGYGFQIIRWPVEGREQPIELVGHLGIGYGSSSLLLRDLEGVRVLACWNNIDVSPFNPMLIEAAFVE